MMTALDFKIARIHDDALDKAEDLVRAHPSFNARRPGHHAVAESLASTVQGLLGTLVGGIGPAASAFLVDHRQQVVDFIASEAAKAATAALDFLGQHFQAPSGPS